MQIVESSIWDSVNSIIGEIPTKQRINTLQTKYSSHIKFWLTKTKCTNLHFPFPESPISFVDSPTSKYDLYEQMDWLMTLYIGEMHGFFDVIVLYNCSMNVFYGLFQ